MLLVLPSAMARKQRDGNVGRVDGFMLACDDQTAVVVIVEIGIILGDEGMAARPVHDLVLRPDHPHQRNFEDIRGIADGVGHGIAPRRHAIERAMGLDVVKRTSSASRKPLSAPT